MARGSTIEFPNKYVIIIIAIILTWILGTTIWNIAFKPRYEVWKQGLTGQAELARAEQNRKITILEAEAKRDSAEALRKAELIRAETQSEAEIIRAKGAAEANRIIGDSLKENEAYLRYLWIQGLNENSQNVIYVPTEANLPILEAGKRLGAK